MHTALNQEKCYQFATLTLEEREAQMDFTRLRIAALSEMELVTIYYNWLRCSSPDVAGTLLQPRPYGGDALTAGTWARRGRTLLTQKDEGAYVAEFRRFARLYLSMSQTGSSPYSLKWFISFWRGDDVFPGRNGDITSINVLPHPISAGIPPLARATPGLRRGTVVCAARNISFPDEEGISVGQLGRVESRDERVCNVQFSQHKLVVCLWNMLLAPIAQLPRKWLPPSLG